MHIEVGNTAPRPYHAKYAHLRPAFCFVYCSTKWLGGHKRKSVWRRIARATLLIALVHVIIVIYLTTPTRIMLPFQTEENILASIDIDCDQIFSGSEKAINFYANWTYPTDHVTTTIQQSQDKCATLDNFFTFRRKPLSQEELKYPIAYGMLVHKDFAQVLLMLSTVYHPQNQYCIAVSKTAKPPFKLLNYLPKCLPNVHIIHAKRVAWGGYEIIRSVHRCIVLLDKLKSKWKYFQYLSGVDAPLRTNLEMVRIFKVLNGTFNVELKEFQPERLKKKANARSPMPMYKSSLSAVFSREAAHVVATNPEVHEYLKFLRGTDIPDEAFWGTIAANPEIVTMPGGFNGTKYFDYRNRNSRYIRKRLRAVKKVCRGSSEPCISSGYISRYQRWGYSDCNGKLAMGSCIFGLRDAQKIVKQHHLVAHKFYLNYQPAAYFCLLKEVERRSLHPSKTFNARQYRTIPQVELNDGIPFEHLTHPEWL